MSVPVPASSTTVRLLARAAVISGRARRLGRALTGLVRTYGRAYPINERASYEASVNEVVACPVDPLVGFYTPCEPGSRIRIDTVKLTGRFLIIRGRHVVERTIEVLQYLGRSNPIELYTGLKLLGGTGVIDQLARYLSPYERAVLYLTRNLKPIVNNPRRATDTLRAGVLRVLHVLFGWSGRLEPIRIRLPTAGVVPYRLVHVVHGDDYVRHLVVYGDGTVVAGLSDGDSVEVVSGESGRVYMGNVEELNIAGELLRIAEFYHWAVVNGLALARAIISILGL